MATKAAPSLFSDDDQTKPARRRKRRRKAEGGGGKRPHRYAVEQTEFFNKDNRPPDPEELARRIAELQAGWSDEVRAKRSGWPWEWRPSHRVAAER